MLLAKVVRCFHSGQSLEPFFEYFLPMDLALKQLIPTYFTDSTGSDIWMKDLLIKKGELIEIVAPSGSGKTSLIHFLYGMRQDYSGSISYSQKEFRAFDSEMLAIYRKDHLSIVFQDMKLFDAETVYQNIEIKRQLAPFHGNSVIKEMASLLGISDKLDSLCKTCSYGEQQRVAIIRSLMQPFDMLLLDEPFSHLDKNNAEKAMQLILSEVRRREATVIFADLGKTEFFPCTRLFHL